MSGATEGGYEGQGTYRRKGQGARIEVGRIEVGQIKLVPNANTLKEQRDRDSCHPNKLRQNTGPEP